MQFKNVLAGLGTAVAASAFLSAALPSLADEKPKRIVIQVEEQEAPARRLLRVGQTAKVVATGTHWIGVECAAVGDALKAQLKLENGLIVNEVVVGAPADKAGIERHDVLISYGDAELNSLEDLVEAVKKGDGKEASVTLLRGGKKKTVEVTPAKRPEVARATPNEAFRDWAKQFGGEFPGKALLVRPGIVVHGGAKIELPAGVSVSITKEADKPAKITVKKDGESWDLTEENLDKLPEDLRGIVQQYLGKMRLPGIDMRIVPDAEADGGEEEAGDAKADTDEPEARRGIFLRGRPEIQLREFRLNDGGGLEKQLEDVMKRLEEIRSRLRGDDAVKRMEQELKELRKEVEELRKEREGDGKK